MENRYQWCIAAAPGEKWAKKVFPELRVSAAVEKLWEAILSTSRVCEDSIKAWNEHNADLQSRCAYLNGLGIEKLHYTADNGTNLTVGMIPEAIFCGGGEVDAVFLKIIDGGKLQVYDYGCFHGDAPFVMKKYIYPFADGSKSILRHQNRTRDASDAWMSDTRRISVALSASPYRE